jgi:hypothetical protein
MLANMAPTAEPLSWGVLSLVGFLAGLGAQQMTIGFSDTSPSSALSVTLPVFEPNGFKLFTLETSFYTSFTGEYEIPFLPASLRDFIKFSSGYSLSFMFENDSASMTTRLLSPWSGATVADRARAALQVLKSYSGAISTYAGVTFGFGNVTGGLVDDVAVNMGLLTMAIMTKASNLVVADGNAAQYNLARGVYLSATVRSVDTVVAALIDNLCGQFSGVLDVFGEACPSLPAGLSAKLGIYIQQPANAGFAVDLGGVAGISFQCHASNLDSSPVVKCRFGLRFFILFLQYAQIVVQEIASLAENTGYEIVRVAQGTRRLARDALAQAGNQAVVDSRRLISISQASRDAVAQQVKQAQNTVNQAAKKAQDQANDAYDVGTKATKKAVDDTVKSAKNILG